MTQIKICGLSRPADIEAVNALLPEYVGFVFAPASRRYVRPETAAQLRGMLDPRIRAVGVFVDERPETVAALLAEGVIDLAQLHGHEDEAYLARLRHLTDRGIIQAFKIRSAADVRRAFESSADYILLDSGAGTGSTFDWEYLKQSENRTGENRPYFLAGGLDPENVGRAVLEFSPFAVDVSSGVETDGWKDKNKMAAFVTAVRTPAAFLNYNGEELT